MLLNQIVSVAAAVDPGAAAFVEPGGAVVTYGEFGETVRRLAGGLGDLSPRPGCGVGVLALNSRSYLEMFLAACWSGHVAVPLNIRWSARELAYAIEDAGIAVLAVDAALAPVLEPLGDALREAGARPPRIVHLGEGAAPTGAIPVGELASAAPVAAAPAHPDDIAAVVYTGGTTGRSRGVMHSHGSMAASALNWMCMREAPQPSRCLLSLPLFHVGALGIAFAQLLQRGALIMPSMFRPDLVRSGVCDLGADGMALVPTMLAMLLESPDFRPEDYRRLRSIAYGASPMPTALLEQVRNRFPSASLTQAYGMTEVGLAVMLTDRWHRGEGARLMAAGQAGPLYEVRIVDAEGREALRGVQGEVVFRGPGLMKGYLNQPAMTAEVLREGWLHSGDVGVMDDRGIVTLLDRKKDMIVSGAENVYSAEVENAVAGHPAVAHCAVIGVPDDVYGERVHAVVVLKPGASLELEDLRAHCAGEIAGYKLPRSLELRAAMPLSPMGKILKTELRAPHWEGRARGLN